MASDHDGPDGGGVDDDNTISMRGSGAKFKLSNYLTTSQKSVAKYCVDRFPNGFVLQGPTGVGKTIIMASVAAARNCFDAIGRETKGYRVCIILSTSSLAIQHRAMVVASGFGDAHVFPKSDTVPRVKDVVPFLKKTYIEYMKARQNKKAKSADVALVMSGTTYQRSFSAKDNEFAEWVTFIRDKASIVSIVVDEIHSHLLERHKNPPAFLKAMAQIVHHWQSSKINSPVVYVFGASASLDASTTIGKLLQSKASVKRIGERRGSVVEKKLIARAVALQNARHAAKEATDASNPCDIVSDPTSTLYGLHVPFYSIEDSHFQRIQRELHFSKEARLVTEAFNRTHNDDPDVTLRLSIVFLNTVFGICMPRKFTKGRLPSPQLCRTYLRNELTSLACRDAVDAILSSTSSLAKYNGMQYYANGQLVRGPLIVAVSASSVKATTRLHELFEDAMKSGEHSVEVSDVITMGLGKSPDKDAKFALLNAFIDGDEDPHRRAVRATRFAELERG